MSGGDLRGYGEGIDHRGLAAATVTEQSDVADVADSVGHKAIQNTVLRMAHEGMERPPDRTAHPKSRVAADRRLGLGLIAP